MSALLQPALEEFGRRFLAAPDLFPARLSGETWGDEEVYVDFPGGPYLIQGLSVAQRDALAERFGCFTVVRPDGPTPLRATAFGAPDSDFLTFDLLRTDYTFDLDYSKASVRLAGPWWMALYLLTPRSGGGFWVPTEMPRLFVMIVENFLRVYAAYRAFECGGAMFHTSCAIRDGGAHLFFGRSGAGKTTITRICERAGLEVLSDDMNVVSRVDGRLMVERLPFAGEFCSRKTAEEQPRRVYPLRAIYRLQKGLPESRLPAARSLMAGQMYVCSSFLNADPMRREEVLTRITEILSAVPAFTLTFGTESSVVEHLFGGGG